MKLMSVDQSLSHCAAVIWDSGKPISKHMICTGSNRSKGKKKEGVAYFDTVTEQILFIAENVLLISKQNSCDTYVMEQLSFGSMGNATRDLAGLFYGIQMLFMIEESNQGLGPSSYLNTITPNEVKSFARDFLPVEERSVIKEKVDKKTGKTVYSKGKLKMAKPEIIKAVDCAEPGFLDGITLSAGKADYADAYMIGKAFITNREALSP